MLMGETDQGDVWSDWLLHRRHADDPEYGTVVQEVVERYADRVLDGARLGPGMTLVDVGCGEGLVAFRAIEHIGSSLRVVLTDISAPLLRHAEALAAARSVRSQCTFLECPADRLSGLADGCADVVTTRAALAYVSDKIGALREFHRVLKRGGRISIAEPILQDDAFYAQALRNRVEQPSPDPLVILLHRWKAAQFPDTKEKCAASPIANYSERDLLNFVRAAGFGEVHLQLHIDVTRPLANTWEVFLGTSPHPWAPSLRRIMAEQFTHEEAQYFEKMIRPSVEAGNGVATDRVAYIQATK
jgi:arsenite methyltransferase